MYRIGMDCKLYSFIIISNEMINKTFTMTLFKFFCLAFCYVFLGIHYLHFPLTDMF
jgi:cbb3-type cytochrome oxidase subunit 1